MTLGTGNPAPACSTLTPMRIRITVEAWKCEICGHWWPAEGDIAPPRCAGCRSRRWHNGSASPAPVGTATPAAWPERAKAGSTAPKRARKADNGTTAPAAGVVLGSGSPVTGSDAPADQSPSVALPIYPAAGVATLTDAPTFTRAVVEPEPVAAKPGCRDHGEPVCQLCKFGLCPHGSVYALCGRSICRAQVGRLP